MLHKCATAELTKRTSNAESPTNKTLQSQSQQIYTHNTITPDNYIRTNPVMCMGGSSSAAECPSVAGSTSRQLSIASDRLS